MSIPAHRPFASGLKVIPVKSLITRFKFVTKKVKNDRIPYRKNPM